jgi:hypothetical protein
MKLGMNFDFISKDGGCGGETKTSTKILPIYTSHLEAIVHKPSAAVDILSKGVKNYSNSHIHV